MPNTSITRTQGSPTNAKKWTISYWAKYTGLTTGQWYPTFATDYDNGDSYFGVGSLGAGRNEIGFIEYHTSSTNYGQGGTLAALRDGHGWYHIVFAYDSTQGTAANRGKTYINGVQATNQYNTDISSNHDSRFNLSGSVIRIGGRSAGSGQYMSGILSHFHFIDGTAYDATSFGEFNSTTGEWQIKTDPSVTYGNNGFFILKDGAGLTDQSPNTNNFSSSTGTLTPTVDNPSNSFATWNSLQATTSASYTFEAGNTRIAVNDVDMSCCATLAAKTGKYYMEMRWGQQGGQDRWGIQPPNASVNAHPRTNGVGWNQATNEFYMLGNAVSGSWGGSIGTNDTVQLAMDLDNGALYLGVNGTWRNSGNPASGSSRTGGVDFSGTSLFGGFLTWAVGKGNNGTSGWNANFGNGYIEQTAVSSAGTNASGNGIFEYDVPTGYTALSTKGINS